LKPCFTSDKTKFAASRPYSVSFLRVREPYAHTRNHCRTYTYLIHLNMLDTEIWLEKKIKGRSFICNVDYDKRESLPFTIFFCSTQYASWSCVELVTQESENRVSDVGV